tara:strand:- start:1337 stop:1528 length:192 start_codon:yes stop_codon:yes gene_type:complete
MKRLKDKDAKYLVVWGKSTWCIFNTETLEGAGSFIDKYHAYDKIEQILLGEQQDEIQSEADKA